MHLQNHIELIAQPVIIDLILCAVQPFLQSCQTELGQILTARDTFRHRKLRKTRLLQFQIGMASGRKFIGAFQFL